MMVRTLLGSANTNSSGVATFSYEGTGEGVVDIVAICEEEMSNHIQINDYTQEISSVVLTGGDNATYGTSITLTATLKDQYGQNITSGTVTFKNGDSTLGTGTISNGVATLTKSDLSIGSYSVTAEIDDVSSNSVSFTISKATPTVVITPPTLVYDDDFNVNGTLKRGSTGLVGETVTLHWKVDGGTEQTAEVQTVSGGEFTFARTAPTTISTYKFWVTYAGNENHNASSTSEVSVDVGKETSVLNVDNPSSVIYGNNATVTGTLMDNDPTATAITGALITITEGASTLGTATTGNDGSFSVSISGLSVGTHSIVVSYAGDNYYTASSDSSNSIVVTQGYSKIVASSDKSILSYADSEKATLYAQLKDSSNNDVALSGVTITFSDGTNTLGTADTDSSGLATLTNGYTSSGAGDISISATDGSLVSETYVLEDCYLYDTLTSDNSRFTKCNACTMTYSDNGMYSATSSSSDQYNSLDYSLPSSYSIECDITAITLNGNSGGFKIGNLSIESNSSTLFIFDTWGSGMVTVNGSSLTSGSKVKFEYNNGALSVYIDEALKGSKNTSNYSPFRTKLQSGRSITIKNMKIKPL